MFAFAMTPETVTITNAIVAALTFVGKTGATEAVKDGYKALKSLVHEKFGAEGKPAQALAELEDDPASEGCKLVLAERLAKVNAAGDTELTASAQSLLDLIRALPSGEQHIQSISGTGNFQNSGHNFSGRVVIGGRSSEDD